MASLHYLRRIVPAALLAATATIGGSAVGEPATACAAPKPWDQQGHDACLQSAYELWQEGKVSKQTYQELAQGCCINWGGKWAPDSLSDAGGTCLPPPTPGIPAGGAVDPGQIPTHTLQPAQPARPPAVQQPGNITQTFEPAPVG